MLDPTTRRATRIDQALTIVVAVGVLLRLRALIHGRSLWLDELFVWSALGPPDLAVCFAPLRENQVAAPLWLALVQSMRWLVSEAEWSLRLPAFVAACVGLGLFARFARRVSSGFGALFSTCALAIGPEAIEQAHQLKHYTTDAVVALGVWLQALALARTTTPWSRAAVANLWITAVVAPWLSVTAPFVLAPCGLVLFVVAASARDRRRMGILLIAGALAATSGLVLDRTLLSHHHSDPNLVNYWTALDGFAPREPLAFVAWFTHALPNALANPGGLCDPWSQMLAVTWIAGVLWTVGAVVLWRADRRAAALVLAPFVAAIALALLHLYPFRLRLVMYLTPALLVPVGAALDALWSARTRAARVAAITLFAAMLAAPLGGAVLHAIRPREREEIRTALENARSSIRPTDTFYASFYGNYGLRYYAPRVGLRPDTVFVGPALPSEAIEPYLADVARLAGRPRVIVVTSHSYPWNDCRAAIGAALTQRGAVRREMHEAAAAAVELWDCSKLTDR